MPNIVSDVLGDLVDDPVDLMTKKKGNDTAVISKSRNRSKSLKRIVEIEYEDHLESPMKKSSPFPNHFVSLRMKSNKYCQINQSDGEMHAKGVCAVDFKINSN